MTLIMTQKQILKVWNNTHTLSLHTHWSIAKYGKIPFKISFKKQVKILIALFIAHLVI